MHVIVVPDSVTSFQQYDDLNVNFDQQHIASKPHKTITKTKAYLINKRTDRLLEKFYHNQGIRTSKWVTNATNHHQNLNVAHDVRIVFGKVFMNDRIADRIWIRDGQAFIDSLDSAQTAGTRSELLPTMAPITVSFCSSSYSYYYNDTAFYNSLDKIDGDTQGIMTYLNALHGKVKKTGTGFNYVATDEQLLGYITNVINEPLPIQYNVRFNNYPLTITIADNVAEYVDTNYLGHAVASNAFAFPVKKTGLYYGCRNKIKRIFNLTVLDNMDTINRYQAHTIDLAYIWDVLGYVQG